MKVGENCAPGEISPMVPPRHVERPETIEDYQALVGHLRERHASIYFAAAEAWRREARWEAHLDAIRERLGVREDSRKLGPILRAIDRLDGPTSRAIREDGADR
jgi:hypothetical protein